MKKEKQYELPVNEYGQVCGVQEGWKTIIVYRSTLIMNCPCGSSSLLNFKN